METIVNMNAVNLEGLDWELRSVLAEQFLGASFNGEQVVLHLADDITDEQVAFARRLTEEHDASHLSPSQQEEEDRTRRLETLRAENLVLLDRNAYDTSSPEIRRLADKIAWLEMEITTRR